MQVKRRKNTKNHRHPISHSRIRYISSGYNRQRKEKRMRLDKDKLNELVTLPDDELWKRVIEIGRSHGIPLPDKTPTHDELEKLRSIARDGSRLNVAAAMKLLGKYRSG